MFSFCVLGVVSVHCVYVNFYGYVCVVSACVCKLCSLSIILFIVCVASLCICVVYCEG